jgi:probable rRNA maturation factor
MTVPQIFVRSRQRKIRVNVSELEKFAAAALKRCLQLKKGKRTDLRKLKTVYVWLVSDWRISRLHLQFFGENSATDVITFHDGEIFISVETARRNARDFGNSLLSEIKLDMVHGLLHLHGFDDHRGTDLRRMRNTQEKILRGMGVRIGTVSQV